MSRIFISYRREDSAPYAGRLYDRLSQRFGADQVFMDVDTIKPGVDFVEIVEAAVGSCDVLIAVIGKHWLSLTGRDGQRRLDHPEDFVRLEVATALKRNVRTIPVLVEGAIMPRSDELPDDLVPLARRHALELSDARWAFDTGRLIKILEEVLDEHGQTGPPARPAQSGAPTATNLAHDLGEPPVPPAEGGTRVEAARRKDAGVLGAETSQAQERDAVGAPNTAPKTIVVDPSGGRRAGRARLWWVSAAVALLVLGLLVGLQLRAATSSRSGAVPQTPPAAPSAGTAARASTEAAGGLVAQPSAAMTEGRAGAAAPHDRPAGAFPIAIGDTVAEGVPGPGAGAIETLGTMDLYTFTARAGQTVYFQVKAASPSSLHWNVTDAAGTVVFDTCLCGDAGAFQLKRGGQYTITVGSATDAQVGTYQFRISAP